MRGSFLGDSDLRGAKLRGADLRGADLRYATKLRGANPSGDADLSGAKLSGAKYTVDTEFPHSFDPTAAGMVLISPPPP